MVTVATKVRLTFLDRMDMGNMATMEVEVEVAAAVVVAKEDMEVVAAVVVEDMVDKEDMMDMVGAVDMVDMVTIITVEGMVVAMEGMEATVVATKNKLFFF